MRYICRFGTEKRGLLQAEDRKKYENICKNVFRTVVKGDYSDIQSVMESEEIGGAEVNIIFTDNSGIQEYNREYRNIDKETDVLSFPTSDFSNGKTYADAGNVNPENDCLMLGDIIISIDRMRSQAEDFGHSDTREIAFLTAHAMLHLMGYDHMTEDEAENMNKLAQKALDGLGYTRDI